jgi:hypothetical protein
MVKILEVIDYNFTMYGAEGRGGNIIAGRMSEWSGS